MVTSNALFEGIDKRSWLVRHRWLILRRTSQISILMLFLLGPILNIWLVKGNLASSLVLETIPLTDPFILLQVVFTGYLPEITAITGALIILALYIFVGGRVYCSWVCPTNLITDSAAFIQNKLHIRTKTRFPRSTRNWILIMVYVLALLSGTLVWEMVNPVSLVFRGLVFGFGLGWIVIVSIFMFDLFVSRRAWCGRLCPMGAFYGIVGHIGLVKINAIRREQCNECMDCFDVCPEPQVISPALKGVKSGNSSIIKNGACTNCGRCIDVCSQKVFQFDVRFRGVNNAAMVKEK